MTLDATRTRVLVAALVALALFAIAFFVAHGGSSDAATTPVRERPASGTALKHAPLRAIGSVPALPRAPRKPRPSPRPATAVTPPPPPPAAVAPPARPPPPPPPPSSTCVDEFC